MQIFVVLVGDRLMNWWDGDGTTVILQDLNPWDSDMTLFFAGQDITMPRYRTLSECNIMDQSTLYLYQGLWW